ncbi:polysaccharide pyruvyl transferase family protein [Myroides odoratimimus]|uniref:polysaccharide pyruvyl transferase family protein n=1 Tax=Myroides odoratimimus TaxID=76832 RepID=UPI0038D39A06
MCSIEGLREIIYEELSSVINNDYVLWDLPYHRNIGDTLIYQGELDFLSDIQYKCLDYSSHIFNDFPELDTKVIILLHGGGNFGDIYPEAQEYRRKVISKYKNNKIILLPQTIHFNDLSNIDKDIDVYNNHPNLFLYFRDHKSYDLAKSTFGNQLHIGLLPDMAFCIKELNIKKYYPNEREGLKGNLFLKRIDNEANVQEYFFKESDFDVFDWPTFEKNSIIMSFLFVMTTFVTKTSALNFCLKPFITFYYNKIVKKYLIKKGVVFLYAYNTIYTTRLHGCILSILMEKKIVLLDNSYGKNLGFYKAWLSNFEKISLYEQ